MGILNLGSGLSLRSILTFLLVHIFADGVVDVVDTSETGAEDIRVDALELAIELAEIIQELLHQHHLGGINAILVRLDCLQEGRTMLISYCFDVVGQLLRQEGRRSGFLVNVLGHEARVLNKQ